MDTSSMRRAGGRARRLLRDPVTWTEWIQIVKTVVAAVVAWMLAVQVFDLPQPFLAPWSALLVVHATVYRSFSRGAKQVGATVVGVLLAWATGDLLGLDAAALAVMLLAGLVIGNLRWLREESTTVGGHRRSWCSPPVSATRTTSSSAVSSTPRSASRSAWWSTCSCGRRCGT